MSRNKLQKFAEMKHFSRVFQYTHNCLQNKKIEIKGKWNEKVFKNHFPIILELGCGKGEYTIELAKIFSNKNFIGIDIKGARIYSGAKLAMENNLTNTAFLRTRIEFINYFFSSGEISEIWITFPDPQIKKKNKRLTSTRFISYYNKILVKNGIIHLKTDSHFLYFYTYEMVKTNHLQILSKTEDLYKNYLKDKMLSIQTFYEQKWIQKGLKIKYLSFFCPEQTEEYIEPIIKIKPDAY